MTRKRGNAYAFNVKKRSKTGKRNFLKKAKMFRNALIEPTMPSSVHFFIFYFFRPHDGWSAQRFLSQRSLFTFDRTIRVRTDNAVNCQPPSTSLPPLPPPFPASRNNARNYLTGPTSWGSILIPRSICRLLFDASAQNLKYICRLRSKDEGSGSFNIPRRHRGILKR